MIKIWILLTLLATPALAQEEAPCQAAHFKQFDFWVGEWDLSWGEQGRGTNRISKILDGCVVLEEFDGTPSMPLRGQSVSTFDRRGGVWKQTWVDNSGGYLDFEGGLEGERMVLSRQAEREGEKFLQRMVWHGIGADALEWNWERSGDGGETWEVLWKIHYTRRN